MGNGSIYLVARPMTLLCTEWGIPLVMGQIIWCMC
jgi:hypothetical protein